MKSHDKKETPAEIFSLLLRHKSTKRKHIPHPNFNLEFDADQNFLNEQLAKLRSSQQVNDFMREERDSKDPHLRAQIENLYVAGIHFIIKAMPDEFARIIKLADPGLLSLMSDRYKFRIMNVSSFPLFGSVCRYQPIYNVKLFQDISGPLDTVKTNEHIAYPLAYHIYLSLPMNDLISSADCKAFIADYKKIADYIENPKASMKKNPDEFVRYIRDTISTRPVDELMRQSNAWSTLIENAISVANQEFHKNQLRYLQGYLYCRVYQEYEITKIKLRTHSTEFQELKHLRKQLEIPADIKALMEKDESKLDKNEKASIENALKKMHSSAEAVSEAIEKQFKKIPTSKLAMDALVKKYTPALVEEHERVKAKEELLDKACESWGKLTSINSVVDDRMTGEVLDRMYRMPVKFQEFTSASNPDSYKHSKGEIQLRAFRLAVEISSADPEATNKQGASDFLLTTGFGPEFKPEENVATIKQLILNAIKEEGKLSKSNRSKVQADLKPFIAHLEDKSSTIESIQNFLQKHPQYLNAKKNLDSSVLTGLFKEIEKCVDTVCSNQTLKKQVSPAKDSKQVLAASPLQQKAAQNAPKAHDKDDQKYMRMPTAKK